jgi:hypothetical protein
MKLLCGYIILTNLFITKQVTITGHIHVVKSITWHFIE